MYSVEFSKATISSITDKIIPLLQEWQQPPLESIYPFVWLDAIHYKIKENGKYISKAVYTILGVGLSSKKEILELYLSENEGANFWLQVLTNLNNRGIQDILIASVDGLKAFLKLLVIFFQKTEDILRVIYTTNIIESVHRQFKKLTKTKGAFPNENSLLKLLYMQVLNDQYLFRIGV